MGRGNVTRVRRFAVTAVVAQEVYASGSPDLTSLGYVCETDPVIGDAYVVDSFAQRLDGRGNLVERRDALGTATTFEFDDAGIYPVGITFANGLAMSAEYEYRYGSIMRYVEVTLKVVR